jgi:uncharacterized membrane protein
MLSNIVPPHTMDTMRVNMTWDGLFHALTWIVTLVGILRLRSAAYAGAAMPSLQVFAGQLILGWGVFNLVEGVIDHQILGIHNVREVPHYMAYNLTFLGIGGVLFSLLGWMFMYAGRRTGAEAKGSRSPQLIHRHQTWPRALNRPNPWRRSADIPCQALADAMQLSA